jgi:predicted RNA-binding Zn ribbon-like protein
LDFLNTRPVQDGEALELLPDFEALLLWFHATGLLTSREIANLRRQWGQSDQARRTLEAVWELREKLRKEIIAWELGATVRRSLLDELNRLMALYPMRTRLKAERSVLSKELWFDPQEPEDLFAPLAYAAATLFTETNSDRVRKCAQCVLHFHDTSKKGTRRWCSMRLCGNRVKVAAYADRRRSQKL